MIRQLERREFVQLGALTTAGTALAGVLGIGTAAAQTAPAPKPATYSVKPLPFDPKAVEGLSEKIRKSSPAITRTTIRAR
jgi:hypothetical protein